MGSKIHMFKVHNLTALASYSIYAGVTYLSGTKQTILWN